MKKLNQNKKRKNKNGNRKAGSRDTNIGIIPHPPAIHGFQVVHNTTLRFTVGTATQELPITYNNLLDCINVASAANLAYRLFRLVKIKRIQAWAVPVIGGTSTVQITFSGLTVGQVGNSITHTDQSMGLEPAYLSVAPSRKSLASDYQPASNNVAFELTLPVGAVIDVHLVFKGNTDGIAATTANAPAGATVGATYWRGLDGAALSASDFLVPTGIASD